MWADSKEAACGRGSACGRSLRSLEMQVVVTQRPADGGNKAAGRRKQARECTGNKLQAQRMTGRDVEINALTDVFSI
jgi:hypothetical protein